MGINNNQRVIAFAIGVSLGILAADLYLDYFSE